jgi:triosephosphate isomerase
MNATASEAADLLNALKQLLTDSETVDVAVCPPFPFLSMASEILKGSRIQLGAQNMYSEIKGAFTGEVAPQMLKDVGCNLVILGHSERRQYFGETDASVNRKIHLALEAGLNPIVCVGETLDQREANETEGIVIGQLAGCFSDLDQEMMNQIVIAYEPVWAIGTGKTATPEQAEDVHRLIRNWIGERFDRGTADGMRIQYGGSVKPQNADQLMAMTDIDGALVGGASLNAEHFSTIIKASAA